MKSARFYSILLTGIFFCVCGCKDNGKKKFKYLVSSATGVDFKNVLQETPDFNILNYMYFYNGGGVAIGDFNSDGLADIYFTGNQVPNKLYVNRGGMKFEDVTETANVAGYNGWCTGVTTADVNGDGRLDIYVSYLGGHSIHEGRNQLFINEGTDQNKIPIFVDRALEFGLDLSGFATQAAFFDYDRDGDLDMYMLNHSLHQEGTFGPVSLRQRRHQQAGDRLLRNDGGRFIEVSEVSGINSSVIGYGLGLAISDINVDGWPDIYVGNDFHENDYLYINQKDGTFKESSGLAFAHSSRFSMGADLADFNNDAFPDVMSVDMLPSDPAILKSSAAEDPYDIYHFKINYGYNHQFARNTLQINNRDGTFSDVALLANTYATDWSWAALFADLNLDGWKDIYVTNGILRRPNDLDYINFISADSVQSKLAGKSTQLSSIIERMPRIKLRNSLFVNNKDSTFSETSDDWGLDAISYSNGAAYGDLDNDGDLDLVVNNLEDEAFIIENLTISHKVEAPPHFLSVTLQGNGGNSFGIGTKVLLYVNGNIQVQECSVTRGFQSAVDTKLVFGLGSNTKADSIRVIWPTGESDIVQNVNADQTIRFIQANARSTFDYSSLRHGHGTLMSKSTFPGVEFVHKENPLNEFVRESLIPHMVSAEGPALAVGDINGDSIDDIYVGGAKRQKPALFLQSKNGDFRRVAADLLEQDSIFEDVDAAFFDADGDRDVDLLVVSGGNEYSGKSPYRCSRLYFNDGEGNFERKVNLPYFLTGSCVALNDYDKDGDIDVFLGARAVPWNYGIPPENFLLQNDGSGNFKDVTHSVTRGLSSAGMVRDALWTDVDLNGFDDLVVVAEWKPIQIFFNNGSRISELPRTKDALAGTNGWWSSVAQADIDGDGDQDMILGNYGENSKLKPTFKKPVRLYVKDFDANDSLDHVLTHYVDDKEYSFHTKDELVKQLPGLKKKFLSYKKFADASLEDIIPREELQSATILEAYTFSSAVLKNLGNGSFDILPLPRVAQFSTIQTIEVADVNRDGDLDLILAGNFLRLNIQLGRNDASFGSLLLGDGNGRFKAVPVDQSGFSVTGEVRSMHTFKSAGSRYLVVGRNDDSLAFFKLN